MVFKAFANDTDALNIHGDALTVTNDPQRIVIAGTLELTRDKAGLIAAMGLKQVIDAVVECLQKDGALPEHVADAPPSPTGSVKNPFA
jgi:hypothetical protein